MPTAVRIKEVPKAGIACLGRFFDLMVPDFHQNQKLLFRWISTLMAACFRIGTETLQVCRHLIWCMDISLMRPAQISYSSSVAVHCCVLVSVTHEDNHLQHLLLWRLLDLSKLSLIKHFSSVFVTANLKRTIFPSQPADACTFYLETSGFFFFLQLLQ